MKNTLSQSQAYRVRTRTFSIVCSTVYKWRNLYEKCCWLLLAAHLMPLVSTLTEHKSHESDRNPLLGVSGTPLQTNRREKNKPEIEEEEQKTANC